MLFLYKIAHFELFCKMLCFKKIRLKKDNAAGNVIASGRLSSICFFQSYYFL